MKETTELPHYKICYYYQCHWNTVSSYNSFDEMHLDAVRVLSTLEVSTSASTGRVRRSDATTFEQNKLIFLSTLPRTKFTFEVCSYISLS